ncbi:MAG: serine/threonine protein kinase [Myxococcales bacterium]|nr:serine/threonine protein kinase [Myxococcales bacterium]
MLEGGDPRYLEVCRLFAEVHALDPADRAAALEAIDDVELRAEVASLLAFDDNTPLVRDAPRARLESAQPGARPPPPVVGLRLDGRYAVQRLVAEGGFGWVFCGQDAEDDAPVAIKLLKPVADAEVAHQIHDAMAREARALGELAADVPGIVGHRGTGTWHAADGEAYPYLVLDWVEGPTLAEWRLEQGQPPMTLAAAMALLEPVAEALRAAHARGVAHRDVKPENLIRTVRRGAPTLVLIDFGAAKLAMERTRGFESTAGGPGMVTYRYCAPEQLDRALGSTGPWSDVHALALVLVELMAGRHPWAGLSLLQTIGAATDPEVRPTPAQLDRVSNPAISTHMNPARMLSPAWNQRDVGTFWHALTEARTGGRRGPLARLAHLLRRN